MRQHTAKFALFLLGGAFVLGLLTLALAGCEEEEEEGGLAVTPTATASPTTEAPQAVTPTPSPPAEVASPTTEAPSPTEEPPPPTPEVTEEPLQPTPAEAPPEPTEEPPPPQPTEEPPPPTPEPSQPTPTPPPTQEPSSPLQGTDSARCQTWIDAGLPPDDLEGASACITFLTDVCLAYLSDPSVAGGAEACQALDILLADHSQPPGGTEGQVVVESCVDDEFIGWSGDTVFELCNGQVWMQASYDYLYHYAYRPDVTIVSTEEGYRMFVEGVSDSILVTQVTDFIRTCIDGDFEGWEGDTIFVLCNGQVWQQASYDYTYHYRYRPDVLIYQAGFGYRMKVEGVDETIRVVRLE